MRSHRGVSGRQVGSSQDRPAYLLRRNGRYYFRRRIPAALRGQFQGKGEFRIALGTSDRREAQHAAERHAAATGRDLDAARAHLRSTGRMHFTARELRRFADEMKALWLKQDDEMRKDASPGALDELAAAADALVEVVQEQPAHRAIRAEAEAFLRSKALTIASGSRAHAQVVEAVRSGCERAVRVMLARGRGASPTNRGIHAAARPTGERPKRSG